MEKNREALTPIWEDVQIRWVPVKSVLAKYIAPDYDMLYLEASCVKDALAELLRQEEENSGALTAKAVLELVATWRILVKGLEEKLQLDKESNKKVKKFDDKVSELEAQMHFVTCIEDIPRSHHDEEKGDKDYKGEKSKKKRKQKP
jgi:hypothetical protein